MGTLVEDLRPARARSEGWGMFSRVSFFAWQAVAPFSRLIRRVFWGVSISVCRETLTRTIFWMTYFGDIVHQSG